MKITTIPSNRHCETRFCAAKQSRWVLLLITLVYFFVPSVTLAGTPAQKDGFYQLKTKHYHVRVRNSAAQCQQVSSHMESLISRYSKIFENLYTKPNARVTILKDSTDYRRYLGIPLSNKPEGTLGITRVVLEKKGTVIEMVSFQQRDLLGVLTHEGMHQFLAMHMPQEIPVWLNEGLACTFEPNQEHRRAAARKIMKENTREDLLEWLLHLGPPTFYANAPVTYPLAWSLAKYLAGAKFRDRVPKFQQFMGDIRSGKGPLGAFKKRFGNLQEVQKKWIASMSS